MNNTTITSTPVLSRAELLAFMLSVVPLSIVGVAGNGVIVYLYARFKTLRAEGGVHIMALLALFDLLNSVTTLQVRFQCFVVPKNNSK